MKKESCAPVVYVPTLHREYVPARFPESVRPLWPGLPARCAGKYDRTLWQDVPCPYTPAEAASCLAELAQLDSAALADAADSKPTADAKTRAERQALNRFAAGEDLESPAEDRNEDRRRWAQRFLLLGWLQEERVLDMEALSERYRAGAAKLAAHLGAGEIPPAEPGTTGLTTPEASAFDAEEDLLSGLLGMAVLPEDTAALLPSWRFMLELLSILLPETALICTADARMTEALAEAGLCQEPLSPALQERFAGQGLEEYVLTCGEEPFWKLLGKKMPQSDRPWLDRRQLVLLCTAKDLLERT